MSKRQIDIQILRGHEHGLFAYCTERLAGHASALWLDQPNAERHPWEGVHRLLHQLAAQKGPEEIWTRLMQRRAVASFVFVELIAELDESELEERRRLAARLESHLSHNWFLTQALFAAWANLLMDIFDDEPWTLVAPVLDQLDNQSVAVIKSLYRHFPDRAPDLMMGYKAEVPAPWADESGLYWQPASLDFQKLAFAIQQQYGVGVIDLGPESPREGSKLVEPFPPSEQSEGQTPIQAPLVAARAQEVLEASSGPLSRESCALIVTALRSAFEGFGYRACLRLGLDLLAREPRLSAEQSAAVNSMMALAAHNLQFHDPGPVFSDFLERHLREALDHEQDPIRRIALLYRLAVTLGRRKKKMAEAMGWIDQALAELAEREGKGLDTIYQRAWILNIRAYVFMRTQRKKEGMADCVRALESLEQAANELPKLSDERERWTAELVISRAVLISNLSSLATMTQDFESFEHWRHRGGALAEEIPDLDRFKALDWIDLYRQKYELRTALDWARKGCAVAAQDLQALWHYQYLIQIADLHYRLGEVELSWEAWGELLDLRQQFGNPDTIRDPRLTSIFAALRGGHLHEAREILGRRLSNGVQLEERAELTALLAQVAALRSDGDAAEELTNQAIDLAAESGERDTLIWVANAAGRACVHLGRPREALAAFTQGVELAQVEGNRPPRPEDVLESILGAAQAGGSSRPLILKALELLPEALNASEAWWLLPKLLGEVANLPPEDLRQEALLEPLRALITAASQRRDCDAALRKLTASFEEELRERLDESLLGGLGA